MAREIVVNLDGEQSRFALSRVSREKLYGRKRRVIVDQLEQECSAATLLRDGSALIPQGGLSSLYIDESFEVSERKSLQAVDVTGEPLEEAASTLGVEQTLTGPVSPERVLDHLTTAVYQLDAEELGDELRDGLERGDIYETVFAYRKGFDLWPAFLLQNGEGVFALVGRPAVFEFLERERVPEEPEDDVDPFEDDLDFSMM